MLVATRKRMTYRILMTEKLAAESTVGAQPRCRCRRFWPVFWVSLFYLLFIDIGLRLYLGAVDREETQRLPFRSKEAFIPGRFEQNFHELLKRNAPAMAKYPKFFLKLNKIASQLYPREVLPLDSLLRTKSDSEADTCGEEYKGRLHGHPFYNTGFEESNLCNRTGKLPISRLVTIVLMERDPHKILTIDLLKSIRDYNRDIPILLGTVELTMGYKAKLKRMFNNLTIVENGVRSMSRPGRIFNFLISKVKTPYTLIGRDMYYFTNFARLERQIYVISSTTAVGVAGGAFRNETGFWKVGCHQSRMRNYVLKYTQGYKYSALDCMVCDYLEGPFVVKTSIAKKFRFSTDFYHQVLFHDWFLSLKQENILVMNCPDALYFKSGLVEGVPESDRKRERKAWLLLAKKWMVDRTEFPSRGSFDFTCDELRLSCETLSGEYRLKLFPLCCMSILTSALKTFDDFAQQYGLDYEIEAGTVLGAVKLGSILPWDKDGDISYMEKDFSVFVRNEKYFRDRGHSVSFPQVNGYFKLLARHFYFEMWGGTALSRSTYPHAMYNISTRIKINGVWMKSVWNPGLFVRNKYGPNVYRHAAHWLLLPMNTSWDIYKPGVWPRCWRDFSHGCLDLYPTDGSEELLPDHIVQKNLALYTEDVPH